MTTEWFPPGARGPVFRPARRDQVLVLFDECGHWAQIDTADGYQERERFCQLCHAIRPVGVEIADWTERLPERRSVGDSAEALVDLVDASPNVVWLRPRRRPNDTPKPRPDGRGGNGPRGV